MPCTVRFSKGADSNKDKKQFQWPAVDDYDYENYIIGYRTNAEKDRINWIRASKKEKIFSEHLDLPQVSLLAFEGECHVKKVVTIANETGS